MVSSRGFRAVFCTVFCGVFELSFNDFEMVFERSFKINCLSFEMVLELILLCLWLWTKNEALAGLVGTTDTLGVVNYCQGKV